MYFLHDETYRSTVPRMVPNSPIPPAPTTPTFITLLDLSVEHRILSLYFLIELQMNITDWKFLNNSPEEVACGWRVVEIGRDRWGCTYWLFDDSRLFREATQDLVDKFVGVPGMFLFKKDLILLTHYSMQLPRVPLVLHQSHLHLEMEILYTISIMIPRIQQIQIKLIQHQTERMGYHPIPKMSMLLERGNRTALLLAKVLLEHPQCLLRLP
jgi:hypothetical protein